MHTTDILVIALYFVLTFGVGILALRRKHESTEDYFLSGRKLPWHLAGLSMVATTFAADTPLAVTGITLDRGIAGNFLWLSLIPSGILTAIFYARLWRRSGAMTDAEFATLRYSGKAAAFLRRFRAVYLALPVNLIIMGWVTTGMAKVLGVFFDYPQWLTLGVLYAFTVVYIILSGLWGVVVTDALQFIIAIVGCIILAVISVDHAGGLAVLWQKADAMLPTGFTNIYPWYFTGPVYVVAVWLGVQWWASWYPGFEPGGGGYVAQRLLSTKNENHAVGAALLFNVLHFVVRPWPWIITALAAAVALPGAADKEMLYPQAILAWLPAGLRGLLIAAFLAAFMSTIATHLNWGASYIMNDVVRGTRFEPKSTRGMLALSRGMIVVMALGAIGVSFLMTSVSKGWELILMLSAGTGPVFMIRWYWKRINALSEISAMCASLVFSLIAANWNLAQEIRLCLVAALTTMVWVGVTLMTKPASDEKLTAFYAQVRPGHWRWRELLVFLCGVVLVYAAFFAIGELLRARYVPALINLAVALVAGIVAALGLSKRIDPVA
ncbi:MAG: sodium:solute symporter family protein [Turneriella sp.]